MFAADAIRVDVSGMRYLALGLRWIIYFEFDLFAYSYVLVLLTVLIYGILLAGVSRRLKSGITHDLTNLDDSLKLPMNERSAPALMFMRRLSLYRSTLLCRNGWLLPARLIVPWENLLTLIAALLLVLAAPYILPG